MQTLPFKDHTVAYQCKGLDQSNIVCEYEVNLSTNEKVIAEKQHKLLKSHLMVKVTMFNVGEKVLT